MESYPRQCHVPNIGTFVEVLEVLPEIVDNNENTVACTLDAKICPDGSAVGRVPPDCEFAGCGD